MKRSMMVVLSLVFAVGMAGQSMAGNIDSPGVPSAGSGMYTLQNLYDYLMSGTALTVSGSFQEPTAGPASTMKSTKQIGDDVSALFAQCDAVAANVEQGKKFFSTMAGSWGVQTGTAYKGMLMKTGQTSVYRPGDDGTYQKGAAFNYAWDVGTDTVKDNVTGLTWASAGNGAGCKGGSSINWTSAIDWAEGLSFAGYSDWRLPNIIELQSLFNRDVGQSPTYINKTYFPNTISFAYWSSSTYPYSTISALCASFDASIVNGLGKGESFYVRAVRGGE